MDFHKAAMTKVTAESILEMITQNHLKCSICLNTFTKPTFLDCHHTFCLSCLEDLRRSKGRNNQKIDCPDCRKRTSLRGRGTARLQSNFATASLIDDITHQKKLLCRQQETTICSLCDEEAPGVIHCTDCDERLCQDCWFQEESNHAAHTVDVLDQKQQEIVPKCKKHRNQEYCYYCTTCKALICAMCSATTHRGQEHGFASIDEADDVAREELSILLSQTEKRLQDYVDEKMDIALQRSKMEDGIVNVITRIQQDDVYDEAPDKEHVLTELEEFRYEREKDFSKGVSIATAKVEWVKHVYDTVSKQVADADKYKLLQMKEEIVTNMKNVLGKKVPILELPILMKIDITHSNCSDFAGRMTVTNELFCNTRYMDDDGILIPSTPSNIRLYSLKVIL